MNNKYSLKILSLFLIFILISVGILPFFFDNAKADGENWLTGWNYRKSHNITGSAGAGTGYWIKIVVHNSSGSDSGDNVHVQNKVQSDFDDIRFTDNDGDTVLTYWRQFINNTNATYWVKVNDDLGGNQVIYIYYGNSTAEYIGNGIEISGYMMGKAEYLGKIISRGGGWDSSVAWAENIIWDDDTNKYWIIYHDNSDQFGLASCATLNGTWVKQANNPIMTKNGGWESSFIRNPYLFRNGSRWWILYEGGDSSPDGELGFAYWDATTDLDTVQSSDIIRDDNNPILSPVLGWENIRVAEPSILYNGTHWVLFYMAAAVVSNNEKIGYATCSSINGSYTKYGGNPILDNLTNHYENHHVADQDVWLWDNQYFVLLTDVYEVGPEHVVLGGYNISDLDNANATKTRMNGAPIISYDYNGEGACIKGGMFEGNNYYYIVYDKWNMGDDASFMARVPRHIGCEQIDLAYGVATWESGHSGTDDCTKAIDDNEYTTGWMCDTEYGYIGIDLGSNHEIGKISWQRTSWDGSNRVPDTYYINVSTDNTSWTNVVYDTGNNYVSDMWTFDTPVIGRYVNMTIITTDSSTGAYISELDVFETKRPFVSPEPSNSDWGSEEILGSSPSLWSENGFGGEAEILGDAAANNSPVISSPNPSHGATGVSISLTKWNCSINDPEGDTFNWSIDTVPDVGNNSASGENNGTKNCTLSGLQNNTLYTVYVNITGGTWDPGEEPENKTYTFRTINPGEEGYTGLMDYGIIVTIAVVIFIIIALMALLAGVRGGI